MKFSYSLLFFFLTPLFYQQAISQVTIGSGFRPEKAALLELKSNEPNEQNITSDVGGLLLSRVSLLNLNTLEPFISTSTSDYNQLKRTHTGLIVYNVNNQSPFVPGLYYWDGQKWNMLTASSTPTTPSNDDNSNKPRSVKLDEALGLPNSYIVSPGKTIKIPVTKAYAIWKFALDADIEVVNNELTAELLWQDEKEMITSVTLQKAEIVNQSFIEVKTSQVVEGNAVVAIKMNGIVRWSWHIWVTDYDPSKGQNQTEIGDIKFMNRYLGATYNLKESISSLGLLYQWGRKDPFPGSAKRTDAQEKIHYTISNQPINKPLTKVAVSNEINLINAIINPTVYYTGSSDWYSNKSKGDKQLWMKKDGTKGLYDPCPEGWQVPTSEAWILLKNRQQQQIDKGSGGEWTDFGYYQTSGRRNQNGDLESVGDKAFVWSATNHFENEAYHLLIESYYLNPQQMSNKSYGQSVRCVAIK